MGARPPGTPLCKPPPRQKAQMFACSHGGLRLKPVVSWRWVAQDNSLCLQDRDGTPVRGISTS